MKVLENHLESEEVLEIRSDSSYSIKVFRRFYCGFYHSILALLATKQHYCMWLRWTGVRVVWKEINSLLSTLLSGWTDPIYDVQACKTWMPAYVKSKDSQKQYQNLDLMLKVHSLIQQRYDICCFYSLSFYSFSMVVILGYISVYSGTLFCRSTKVHLVHVPAHCNIPGNEAADVLAKAGARLDPIEWQSMPPVLMGSKDYLPRWTSSIFGSIFEVDAFNWRPDVGERWLSYAPLRGGRDWSE